MEAKLDLDTSDVKNGFLRAMEGVAQRLGAALAPVADFALGEAKDRAPIDTGTLTENLRSDSGRDGNVFFVSIYVPVNAPAASYAVKTHEGLYALGEASKAKQAKMSVTVGAGYISRAFTENIDTIQHIIAEEMKT